MLDGFDNICLLFDHVLGAGSQTIIQSASEFRAHCTAVRGLDCMRRQALVYPFDGMDILEDLAPWNRVLQPRSASGFSNGPSMQVFKGVDFLDGIHSFPTRRSSDQIGRASCRERV